jgi:hypothetical protein
VAMVTASRGGYLVHGGVEVLVNRAKIGSVGGTDQPLGWTVSAKNTNPTETTSKLRCCASTSPHRRACSLRGTAGVEAPSLTSQTG